MKQIVLLEKLLKMGKTVLWNCIKVNQFAFASSLGIGNQLEWNETDK